MTKSYSLEGVQAILSYPFKQPGWQSKFLVGAALTLANYIIPIIPAIFMTGYFAQIMRNVIVDQAEPSLPEWDEWGKLFSRGFKVTCATIIYLLPSILLMVGGYLLIYVPFFITMFSSGGRYDTYTPDTNMLGISMVGMFAGFFLMLVGFILYIPLALILPPAISHLVAKDSFAAAFRVREWWAILRANLWGFFTAASVIAGSYMLLLLVVYAVYFTIILCLLMPILLSVAVMYLSVVAAPLLGEAYRKGVENLAAKA